MIKPIIAMLDLPVPAILGSEKEESGFKPKNTISTKKKFTPCDICASPVRRRIEEDLAARAQTLGTLVKKYHIYFPRAKSIHTITHKLERHRHHMNWPECLDFKPVVMESKLFINRDDVDPVTLESFAQKMLKIGDKSLDFYERFPSLMDLNTVVASQRLIIEKQKVNVAESALKLSMSKLFGGFFKDGAVEGEIEDDGPKALPTPKVVQSSDKK
ncbi:MAG: hypothetical protein U1D67_05230 [Dehalococcoidia bacterium]|nr:hypothetical protein [Dehalococcoidia bacterium]